MPFLSNRRWRGLQRLVLLALLAVFVPACADTPETPAAPARTPIPAPAAKTPTPARAEAPADEQTWLVLLYSDADDEILEEDMLNDLNEAELVGSSDRVKLVAQMDRYDGGYDGDGDWTSAKRFLIEQDDDLEQLHSRELDDLGEVNMADADTLIDFVAWGVQAYPADKYVLIMSDHGAGWPGGWSDPAPETSGRDDIPLAESFGDMLFLMEIGDALKQIVADTGIGKFELIGFDACLMSSVEVYSAIAPYARYAVASQEVEPSLGWAYAALLGRLADSPEIDGGQLAGAIVDSYIEQDQQILDDQARAKYVERAYEYSDSMSAEDVVAEEIQTITLTAVDLSATRGLLDAINGLVRALARADQKKVASARRYAQAFETVFDDKQPKPYIDLGNFARLLKQKIDDRQVDNAADALIAAIDRTVIDEKHGEEKAGATGISIHFPNSKLYKDAEAGYESYDVVAAAFVQQSLWDDFLAFHYTKKPLPEVQAQQPAPATPVAPVEAPGGMGIEVAPLTLSSDTFTRKQTLLMQSTVTGGDIAFIYVFIGYRDPKAGAIRVMDMDFIEADQTRQVDGVFYPDWGAEGQIDVEFEWDGRLFAIDSGEKSEVALFQPDDYGASSAEAVYSVEGTYTTAKGKKPRRAMLLFSDGELTQVLGYTGKEDAGSLREITPKRGDRFTIGEQWISSDNLAGEETEFFSKDGKTLVFGEDNFSWKDVVAPKGEYLVGFIAEDLDGKLYEAHATVSLK
jgi:clostripain